MEHFNGGAPFNLDLKKRISQHLEYKWANDHNQAIDDPEELDMLDQLPPETQDQIYTKFLFREFLVTFRSFFTVSKSKGAWGNNLK